jgi:hypothetical protein
MAKTNHTPGPWQAYNSRNGRIFKRWRITRRGARTIAEICENNSPEIELANAVLIQCAPCLLVALQDLVDYAEDVAAERDERPGSLARARVILAAATAPTHQSPYHEKLNT